MLRSCRVDSLRRRWVACLCARELREVSEVREMARGQPHPKCTNCMEQVRNKYRNTVVPFTDVQPLKRLACNVDLLSYEFNSKTQIGNFHTEFSTNFDVH